MKITPVLLRASRARKANPRKVKELAHALPADWDGVEIPRLVPAPAPLRERDERLLGMVRRVFSVAGEVALGLGAAVAGGLDPLVLGGVQHPTLPVVDWVLPAQWNWD